MLIQEILSQPAVTISPETTLAQAHRTMRERGIRHLPVLEGGRLVGVVTDRDLRLATSTLAPASCSPETTVGAVMQREPLTAQVSDPVEDAARVMRERKIGCLPVLDGERVVGIVTGMDLLDALLRLTGVDQPSTRIEVRLQDHPGVLARLMGFFAERQLNVHSILTYPEGGATARVVLRVGSIDKHGLARDLRGAGFEVLWPPAKPWRR